MTSTPTLDQIPIEEQPVLEALVSIKHRLTVIKKDRSQFIKASTVTAIYEELSVLLQRLEEIRGGGTTCNSSNSSSSNNIWSFRNNVNSVLDDVFVILSLCFMAIGKTKESPATYVQLLTIKDLKQYEDRLKELETIIRADEAKGSIPDIQTRILRRKLDYNNNLLTELKETAESISPELAPIHRRLVQLKIELGTLASRTTWDSSEIRHIQEELREIESKRVDGKFLDSENTIVRGQAAVIGLLEDCYDDCHSLLATKERVPKSLQDIFDRLQVIKTDLERLVLTQRWTLRETDLWQYEIQLSEISALRKDGKFVNRDGNVEEDQALLNFMLHKCYRLIYVLLSASEPIAEALVPIHNQLLTVRRCLLEMKLASIDNMRVDGRFLDKDKEIPEGQGICNSLLSECYDILYELQGSVIDESDSEELDEEEVEVELRGSLGLDVVV
ncbi:hypothetical protein BGZ65_007237 [Modicella reniformis]|uniref:Uncharacterized protein n=1 Tax=Modicella reniformis TaxID=1440133 RepID=A0A9P6INM1_9FUNG|nr:hypothetical protein BGZ65_007237 [Modicella reniformis]